MGCPLPLVWAEVAVHFSKVVMKKKFSPGGLREVLSIAVPMVISNSAFTVMQFCDRVFLARYSDLAIQASMPAGILSFTLICLFTAIAGYSSTFVAQYHGAGERANCVHATMQGVYFMLLCTPVFLLLIPVGYGIIGLFDHAPALVAQERIYLRWMLYGAVPIGLSWSISGFFTGRSLVRLNTVANIIGCVVNIVLDYAMIFGHFGLPRLGLKGAAIATCISCLVSPSILFVYMLRSDLVREMGWRKAFGFDFGMMKRLMRFGLPAGFQILLDVGAFSVFVLMTASLDSVTLTVANIAFSINNLAFSPLMGFGAAASILSGQYQGGNDSNHAMRSGWSALRLGWIYMAFIGTVFVVFPETLISLFTPPESEAAQTESFMRTGRHLLYVMTAWGVFDVANIIFIGALKGVGDTKFVMTYMSLLAWLLWIPGEVLIFKLGGGIIQAWLWLGGYIFLAALGFGLRWHRGKWQKIRMIN